MRRRLMILAALPFLLAAGAHAQAQGELKIGVVNLDRILRESAPAVRAEEKLRAEFAKREQELAKMAEQGKKMQESLEKNAVTSSEADRRAKERELNDFNREFQRRQREFREDMNTRRQEELQAIIDRANRAVRAIAQTDKLDLILQDAVYVSPRIDITDRVIKALDEPQADKK